MYFLHLLAPCFNIIPPIFKQNLDMWKSAIIYSENLSSSSRSPLHYISFGFFSPLVRGSLWTYSNKIFFGTIPTDTFCLRHTIIRQRVALFIRAMYSPSSFDLNKHRDVKSLRDGKFFSLPIWEMYISVEFIDKLQK